MKIKHVTSARQFNKEELEKLFRLTDKIKASKFNRTSLSCKMMATPFYEPSTRPRLSFESAMLRLGGSVITTENASQFSSAAKGETLEDTIRIIGSYADVIVLRHFNPGASDIAAKFSSIPIINAGDGNGEHPTQALLDLYTILSKFKKNNFTVTMVGDLKNGRTIHSLSYLLSLYPQVKIIYISPEALSIPEGLKKHLEITKVGFEESENLKYGLELGDIIYQTRIQKERFKNRSLYRKYFGKYVINNSNLKYLRKTSFIMHPLPRVNEIAPEVDLDARAIYFEQASNGVYVRMALLLSLFDKAKPSSR